MVRVVLLIIAIVCQSLPGWMRPVCTAQCPQYGFEAMSCCAVDMPDEADDGCACCMMHHEPAPEKPAPSHHDHDWPVLAQLGAASCPSLCCSVHPIDMPPSPAAQLVFSAGVAPVAVIELPVVDYEPPLDAVGASIRSAMRDGSPPREREQFRATLNIWTL